jgi:DnaJ-class molecular chaperone
MVTMLFVVRTTCPRCTGTGTAEYGEGAAKQRLSCGTCLGRGTVEGELLMEEFKELVATIADTSAISAIEDFAEALMRKTSNHS